MAIETRFLIGGFGDILVIVFIFMPVVQIVQMCKKTLRPCDVSYLIFAVNGTTAMFFFCDFIRIKDIIGFIPNAISLPLNLICFIIHAFFHYDYPAKIYVIVGSLVYTTIIVSLSLLVLPITVVSSLAVFFNVTMGLATFQKFYYVCKTYDYKVLPVFINIFALFSSGFMVAYGIMADLPEITIPNVVMEVLCAIAIVFYFVYKKKYEELHWSKESGKDYGELKEVC
eukprot:TRINITY_DN1534_c0_g1_i1.p1 TRINITY_DN1534_c0_g1~~TRINITY_DN1534_c0_g1_i1.p1  ORF type:complete len:227 (-),score=61.95 TRINITY_DN1534_c0_g1_i1:77-757(-)